MDCNDLDELSIKDQSLTNESEFTCFEILKIWVVEF